MTKLVWGTNSCPVLYCLSLEGFIGSLGEHNFGSVLSWLFYIGRQHWSLDQSVSIYGEYTYFGAFMSYCLCSSCFFLQIPLDTICNYIPRNITKRDALSSNVHLHDPRPS